MRIHELKMEKFRGYSEATINFAPNGLTMLVGENGAGKSSVLWALRVALSHILKKTSPSKENLLEFQEDDVANGSVLDWPYLSVAMEFGFTEIPDKSIWFSAQKNRRGFKEGTAGSVREQVMNTPDTYEFFEIVKYKENNQEKEKRIPANSLNQLIVKSTPLAVYYSAHRATMEGSISKPGRTSGNEARSYAEALQDRSVKIAELSDLWRKESFLKESDGIPDKANQSIQDILPAFLEGFSELHLDETTNKPVLKVKKNGTSLSVSQLSDGERSMLVILMDLTRRLALANPHVDNPAKNTEAIVLIDELDLHLHPRWQRTIVKKLTQTFEKCQFIATTHSPQIVGEIKPENLVLLKNDNERIVVQQNNLFGYGHDSSWILRNLMGADSRAPEVDDQRNKIENALEDGDLDSARLELSKLRDMIVVDDDEIKRLEASISNLEASADEIDS